MCASFLAGHISLIKYLLGLQRKIYSRTVALGRGRIACLVLWGTLVTLTSCSGGSGSVSRGPSSQIIAGAASNLQLIVVNGGLADNYTNGAFTSRLLKKAVF
jgi:hypothetical protein